MTESVSTEIRRINGTARPVIAIQAVNPSFVGSDYLQCAEALDSDMDAFLVAYHKVLQDARQLERKVLRLETDMRARDNGTRVALLPSSGLLRDYRDGLDDEDDED